MDDNKTFEETAEHYERKMDNLYYTIQALKNRCIRLQNENKVLRKKNEELIRAKKKEQHYKNGKRGSRYNG